jgi:folate-dependent phosphoribosylglycinamide formyltransferase PurN
MKWAALYSQSGSEICDISDKLGRYPDLVISDNVIGVPKTDSRIVNASKCIYGSYKELTKKQKQEYYNVLEGYDLITLHGWLNIVPEVVCEKYDIYNGHPGLINYYPELKGRDPQIRTWDSICTYMYIGSVVHKVTPVVDDGEILTFSKAFSTQCTSLDDTFNELRKTSLESWIEFLGTKL